MSKQLYLCLLFLCSSFLFAQDYFPKNDGVSNPNTNYTAFTNAKIHITPTEIINNGTLLIKDGKIISSGKNVTLPENTITIDIKGKSIYPSFIELYSSFGVEKPKRVQSSNRSPQYDASREGFYWNDHIRPEQNAIDYFSFDEKTAVSLRKAGFGLVNTHLQDGIIRGTGALVALTENEKNSERIVNSRSAQYTSFSKSVKSRQSYPSSLMGSLALLRQVSYDADWYAKGNPKNVDRALEAYNKNKNLVQIIAAGSRINALRADKVGDEIGVNYVILGGGDEYERINDIKSTNASYIIPVKFPEAYDVEDPFIASFLDLETMREWNQKPSNLKVLSDNNIEFSITTNGLKSPALLKTNLIKAIQYGLDKDKALEALTIIPAKILGQSNNIGSLKNGSLANFLITSGHPLDKKTTVYQNWIKGKKHEFESIDIKDINGEYNFTVDNSKFDLTISGTSSKPVSSIKSGTHKIGSKISYKDNWVTITFKSKDSLKKEYYRIVANVEKQDNLKGKIILPNGNEESLTLVKSDSNTTTKNKKTTTEKEVAKTYPVTYPNGAYGFKSLPEQETILFKNATVWTNEPEGILEQTDVLIKDGKIAKVGKNLPKGNANVVDATGKHLTTGIIDEHSHIATSTVNEGGQNSSAEVSIEDVVNPEDVKIYRNLAGGVTSIQILHGSANPIGGRSAIIKLKWGESADNLIYDNSPKFIKFALGENVKQSNWQSFSRFPQTRMGVEQVYVDYFTRAKEYDALKKSGKPYRKDIELEVLAEILNKERFISCHSYVQSEINMLMKVAEQFDFNINTFTHILEGYKVADKMKAHGVGGSTFSDWWAYKYEVNDAIPYNPAIMHNVGVTVAINSDDAEMSRRLNQEAAKAVKYGGVSEEDAWKFVTLNPAKLLHIDERVGSIKVGKDADIVLWSDNPLSVYSKAEKTLIEGKVYFDIERDKELRNAIKKEKSELINLMLQEKNKGMKTQPIKKKVDEHFHCDTMDQNN